jgi:hypothetical protein
LTFVLYSYIDATVYTTPAHNKIRHLDFSRSLNKNVPTFKTSWADSLDIAQLSKMASQSLKAALITMNNKKERKR